MRAAHFGHDVHQDTFIVLHLLFRSETDEKDPHDEEISDGFLVFLAPEVPKFLFALRLGNGTPEERHLGDGTGNLGMADFPHGLHLGLFGRHDEVDPLDPFFRESERGIGRNARGLEAFGLEGKCLDGHSGDDPEAAAQAGISSQQTSEIRSRDLHPRRGHRLSPENPS